MPIEWEYPIAALAHGGGYASVVDSHDDGDDERHSLIVITEIESVTDTMQQLGILGAPKWIRNAREFRWLIESLRHPVTHVAFDLSPVDGDPNPSWHVAITELLASHLPADYSPWNYPIFVVAIEEGFVSIAGSRTDGSELHALVVFSSEAKAEAYVEEAKRGELCKIQDLDEAVKYFGAMAEVVDAVALDPAVENGGCRTERCFDIETLLEKYLVEIDSDTSPPRELPAPE